MDRSRRLGAGQTEFEDEGTLTNRTETTRVESVADRGTSFRNGEIID